MDLLSDCGQLSSENKELRRQSQALLDLCPDKAQPQLPQPMEENSDFQAYLEKLNARMEGGQVPGWGLPFRLKMRRWDRVQKTTHTFIGTHKWFLIKSAS